MNEFYVEQLIEKKAGSKKEVLLRNVLLGTGLVLFFLSFLLWIFVLPALVLFAIVIVIMKEEDIEFEYLLLNKELDIDKIIGRKKRKNVYKIELEHVVVMAKLNANELRPFEHVTAKNFSSGLVSDSIYKMVMSHNGKQSAIIIEPNEELLQGMKIIAPRTVFI